MTEALWQWVVAVGGGVGVLVLAYLRGMGRGREQEQRRRDAARLEGAEARSDAERVADRTDDPGAVLARDWMRPPRH